MHETARVVFSRSAERYKTFQDFEDAFKKYYCTIDYRLRAERELENYQQRDESIDVYIANVHKLCQRAGVESEAEKCKYFSRGVNETVYLKLLRKNPKTIAEMEDLAREVEQQARAARHRRDPPEMRAPVTMSARASPRGVTPAPFIPRAEAPTPAPAADEVGDLVGRLSRLSINEVNAVLNALGIQNQARGRYQPNAGPTQAPRGPLICYRCNQPGHRARDCTATMPVQSSASVPTAPI